MNFKGAKLKSQQNSLSVFYPIIPRGVTFLFALPSFPSKLTFQTHVSCRADWRICRLRRRLRGAKSEKRDSNPPILVFSQKEKKYNLEGRGLREKGMMQPWQPSVFHQYSPPPPAAIRQHRCPLFKDSLWLLRNGGSAWRCAALHWVDTGWQQPADEGWVLLQLLKARGQTD